MFILRWIVQTLVGPLLDGLAGMIRDRRARDDAVALGRAQQEGADRAAAEEARKRMEAAQAGPRGRETTQEAMRDGSF